MTPVLNLAQYVSICSSIAIVLLTAILAYYTRNLAKESEKTRRVQIDPNVIVTAVLNEDRPQIVMLTIRNIGNGLATNITIKTSVPLVVTYGIVPGGNNRQHSIEEGPFVTGIPSLGPGEFRKMDWGQPGGLIDFLGKEVVTVSCKYFSQDGRMLSSKTGIDIQSFMMSDASSSMTEKAVKELKRIANGVDKSTKAIEKMLNNSNAILNIVRSDEKDL